MTHINRPNPILNKKEEDLLKSLTKQYEKFIAPSKISIGFNKVKNNIEKLIPQGLKDFNSEMLDKITESDLIKKMKDFNSEMLESIKDSSFIQKVIENATQGFLKFQSLSSIFTLDSEKVTKKLIDNNCEIESFDDICYLRSYHIARTINKQNYKDLFYASFQGGVTGFFGFPGVPFNIVLSFFLYFRAVQSIALYYGYDIKDDPDELEIASQITFQCLFPQAEEATENISGIIGKMMFAAELTSLKTALGKTYEEMIKQGGSKLLYVQIRALANKAANKALNNAGQKGLETQVFKNLLEQIGKYLSKEASKKAIPVIGALISALLDLHTMNKVLKGANMIYHKRFLFEKETRIEYLEQERNENVISETKVEAV